MARRRTPFNGGVPEVIGSNIWAGGRCGYQTVQHGGYYDGFGTVLYAVDSRGKLRWHRHFGGDAWLQVPECGNGWM